jgi:hypothetical protein
VRDNNTSNLPMWSTFKASPIKGRLLALFTNIGQGTNDFSSLPENKKYVFKN